MGIVKLCLVKGRLSKVIFMYSWKEFHEVLSHKKEFIKIFWTMISFKFFKILLIKSSRSVVSGY